MSDRIVIPIKYIENGIKKTRYINVTNQSLTKLIKLKKTLEGVDVENAVAIIDSIIYTSYIDDNAYNSLQSELNRTKRRRKMRIQSRINKYSGGKEND